MARLRSFLAKATYDWIVDHNLTPYLLVDAMGEGVEVPQDYVDEGRIVLNISPMAVRNLQIESRYLSFEASFSGEAWQVYVPMEFLLGLYARENSQGIYARDEGGLGMIVNEGEEGENPDPTAEEETETEPNLAVRRAKSKLRVVK